MAQRQVDLSGSKVKSFACGNRNEALSRAQGLARERSDQWDMVYSRVGSLAQGFLESVGIVMSTPEVCGEE